MNIKLTGFVGCRLPMKKPTSILQGDYHVLPVFLSNPQRFRLLLAIQSIMGTFLEEFARSAMAKHMRKVHKISAEAVR